MNASMMKDVRQWVITFVIAAVMATAATTTISQINDGDHTVSPSIQYIDHNHGNGSGGG